MKLRNLNWKDIVNEHGKYGIIQNVYLKGRSVIVNI